MEFNIVLRKDLQMRRGKLCGQATHAGMKWILDLFDLDGAVARMPRQVQAGYLSPWIESGMPVNVFWATGLEDLELSRQKLDQQDYATYPVYDLGRTEFKGYTTHTAFAYPSYSPLTGRRLPGLSTQALVALMHRPEHHDWMLKVLSAEHTKQVIVCQTAPKPGLESVIAASVQAGLGALLRLAHTDAQGDLVIPLQQQHHLVHWLMRYYTKIVVGHSKFDEFMADFASRYRQELGDERQAWCHVTAPGCLALPPLPVSQVDRITGELRLI